MGAWSYGTFTPAKSTFTFKWMASSWVPRLAKYTPLKWYNGNRSLRFCYCLYADPPTMHPTMPGNPLWWNRGNLHDFWYRSWLWCFRIIWVRRKSYTPNNIPSEQLSIFHSLSIMEVHIICRGSLGQAHTSFANDFMLSYRGTIRHEGGIVEDTIQDGLVSGYRLFNISLSPRRTTFANLHFF